ncbi:MAG: hypothetical protein ACE5NC_01115 [Anaerolineae bacterium]
MNLFRIPSLAIGSIFLGVSTSFAAVKILQHVVGIPIHWDPSEALYASAPTKYGRHLLDAVILFGPVLAIVAFTAPQISIRFDGEAGRLATIVVQRPSRAGTVLMGASLLVLTVFAVYLFGENLPCILGQQRSC